MRDMYTMIENKPSNVNITAFYLTQGCRNGCKSFSAFDEVVNTLRSKFPWLNVVVYQPPNKDYSTRNYNQMEYVKEMFSPARIHNNRMEWSLEEYNKHLIINYFFISMKEDALRRYPMTEYFVSCEDDQTYDKNARQKIVDVMRKDPNE